MQRIPFLNGFHLKLIAICTMFIDHLGYTLFPGDLWLRCVGRVAFPIFCFLIAEGCVYTHDRRKYALRLLAFALLSEIPFNLMNSGAVWDSYHQNVLWTLLTGALVCWLIDWALKNRRALAFVLTALVMAAAFYLLERLNTDYGGWGMLLVVMFYGVHRAPGGAVSKMIAQLFGLTFLVWPLWAAMCPSSCGRWWRWCPSGSITTSVAFLPRRCSTAFTPFTPSIFSFCP